MKANHPVEAARWAQAIARSIEWARREGGGATGTDGESAGINGGTGSGNASVIANRRKSGESDKSVSASVQSTFSQRATATAGTLLRRGKRRLEHPLGDRHSVANTQSRYHADAVPAASGFTVNLNTEHGQKEGEGEGDDASDADGDGDDEGEGETADDSSAAESRGDVRPPHETVFELQANTVAAQMELTVQLLANLAAEKDGVSLGEAGSVGSVSLGASWASVPSEPSSRGVGLDSSSSSSSLQRLVPVQIPERMDHAQQSVLLPRQSLQGLRASLSTAHTLLSEYTGMVQERETWWRRSLEKERKRQKVWEESLATVVKEGETLERELRARSRKRGSRFFDVSVGEGGLGTVRGKRTSVLGRMKEEVRAEGSFFPEWEKPLPEPEPEPKRDDGSRTEIGLAPAPAVPPKSPTTPTPTTGTALVQSPSAFAEDDESMAGGDTDEEDEFFDAIEYGTLTNLVVPQELTSPSTLHAVPSLPSMFHFGVYEGYKSLRTHLNLNEERPPTSLWSVLKHSIGKDLTRISFPVFFNEPTSMLQRMAEDMEFSECCGWFRPLIFFCVTDGLRFDSGCCGTGEGRFQADCVRCCFCDVELFLDHWKDCKAFQSYASMFHLFDRCELGSDLLMQGETFEYVRFDREYRYVSEQVSHHPPISACWAESPLWHYYGEVCISLAHLLWILINGGLLQVDAQNKFMGKSFEIRPTGVAHVDLLIPEERGPGYPKASGKEGEGKVVEHYSWKKVTTNVSGFILGSPTIDHYGDMIVRFSPVFVHVHGF